MKNFRSNTARRIIALVMSLVILTLAVPTAMAENNNFAGTRWYASKLNLELLKAIDPGSYELVKAIASLISLVPDASWLDMPSFMAICCVIDFSRDGTFTITFLGSTMGEIDWSSYASATGSWSSCGNMLRLTVDGDSLPLTYSDGVLSLCVYGFGLDFERI